MALPTPIPPIPPEPPPPPPPPTSPPEPTAAPTLAYAGEGSVAALPARVRAWPLLVPNLIAVSVLFLPLHSNDAPIEPVLDYARQLLDLRAPQRPSVNRTWEAMITAPFLLALPLALWTLRLTIAPRPGGAERAIAWSITLASLVMTMLCVGYCVSLRHQRFILPVIVTLIVLGVAAACVLSLWGMRRAWPTALLAMTAAWAANTTLTSLVLLSHQPWRVGIIVGVLVALAQVVVMVICARDWRRAAGAGGAPAAGFMSR